MGLELLPTPPGTVFWSCTSTTICFGTYEIVDGIYCSTMRSSQSCLYCYFTKVAYPLNIAAKPAITHRTLLTLCQKPINDFISVPSAHRLELCVLPCLTEEGTNILVSGRLKPSSFSRLWTFHFRAPLIPGSMKKNVIGKMLKTATAATT